MSSDDEKTTTTYNNNNNNDSNNDDELPITSSETTTNLAPLPVLEPHQYQYQPHNTFFYSEQDIVYPNIPFYHSAQFSVPTTSIEYPSSSSQPQPPQRRNALQGSAAASKIYRHKKLIDNLSISSALNTVHIKNESQDFSQFIENASPSKKIKLEPRTELKDTELDLRNAAIKSLEQRIQINDFAKKLQITRPDIQQFQITKPTVKQSQERERNKNIFAIRCLFECFVSDKNPSYNFQSKVIRDSLTQVISDTVTPSTSLQQSKSQTTFIATPRSVIYTTYILICDVCNVEYLGQSGIGKLVRIAFPMVTTKRLGTRGNSKYHYVGIGALPWIRELAERYQEGKFQFPQISPDEPLEITRTNNTDDYLNVTEQSRNSLIKAGQSFNLDFNFFERIHDPMVERFYFHLSNGDIDKMVEFIMKLNDDASLHDLYYKTLLYLCPLSYQLGDNTILNNLNYISLNLDSFEFNDHDFLTTKFFLICLSRLIKASRCSLSLSNMLFIYYKELSSNFKILGIRDIINLEIDDVMERFLFWNFFKNFENFLINIPVFITEEEEEEEEEDVAYEQFVSPVFGKHNRIIMKNFVEFLIIEIRKFETRNLRVLILNFTKIITSINDEIIRHDDLNLNFNNWWIINCWLSEWLNFCGELIAFKDEV